MDLVNTFTTFLAGLALTISGFFGSDPTLGAQPALTVPQGGTGWSNIVGGTLLYGTGSGLRLATTSTTTASCSGSTTCDPFVVIGSSPVTISSTGGSVPTDTVLWSNASTSPWSVLSLNVNSSSSIAYLSVISATTTNATTTSQGVSYITALGSGGLTFNSSNGTQVAQFGAGGGSNATFLGGVNIDGSTRLATSLTGILKATAGTVSVATAGTEYANFGYPFTPATNWFSTSTISLNTAGLISTASSSIAFLHVVNGTTTNATSTIGSFSTHLRSTGTTRLDNMTSAILLTGATGVVAEYTGIGCTNQVVEDVSALGAGTCVSINNGYWSGTDLSVANGGTGLSTFGGTNHVLYTTATDTLSSEAAFTYSPTLNQLTTSYASTTMISASATASTSALWWSGGLSGRVPYLTTGGQFTSSANFLFNGTLLTALGTSVTNATTTGTLALPIGANPFTLSDGQCAIDTTSGQLRCDIGTQGERVLTHPEGLFPMVVSFASTSLNTSTTTRYLGPAPQAMTFQKAQCDSSKHLSFSLYDGTNRANFIIASSTIGTTTFSTNNSFFQGESIRMDIGTTTSAAVNVTAACTLWFTYDKQ